MSSRDLLGSCSSQEEDHLKDETAQLGEMLHSAMVRAAIEEGLAHHTPETLRELMRTGVYKGTDEEARLEREKKKVRVWSTRSYVQSSHLGRLGLKSLMIYLTSRVATKHLVTSNAAV